MKLKFATLIFLAFLWNQRLYSQCKLTTKKDEFTSKITINTENLTIADVFPIIGDKQPWDVTISFYKVDDALAFVLTHESQSYSDDINEIYLKLDDGTVIKKDKRLSDGSYNTGFGYSYKFSVFGLTKDELSSLSKNKVIKLRIVFSYFPDYPVYEKDLKDKKSSALKQMASCLLTEVK